MVAVRLRPSIIVLGDSLAQFSFGRNGEVGWAGLLSQEYQRRADCFNRGFQGYTSKDVLSHVLPELFETEVADDSIGNDVVGEVPVLFWTIILGANDAALASGRQGVPLEEFGQNLDQILTTIRQHESMEESCNTDPYESRFQRTGEVPVILMTPPPCDIGLWKKLCPEDNVPEDGNEIYKSYADQVKAVAQRHTNCSVVDTWSLLTNSGSDTYDPSWTTKGYQTDGIHLTGEGNRVVFHGLMEVIRRDYPALIPMTDGNSQFGDRGVPMEGKLWWMYDYASNN